MCGASYQAQFHLLAGAPQCLLHQQTLLGWYLRISITMHQQHGRADRRGIVHWGPPSACLRWAKVCVRHLSLWRLSAAKYNTVPENQLRASAHLLYGSLSSYLHYLMMATLGTRERRYYTTYGCSVISCPV
jgi:hypothetical protein